MRGFEHVPHLGFADIGFVEAFGVVVVRVNLHGEVVRGVQEFEE